MAEATNAEYGILTELLGLGQPTVGIILLETCEVIAQHLIMKYVGFPQGQALTNVVQGFDARCRLLLQLAGPIYQLFDHKAVPLTTLITKVIIWF